MLYKVVSEQGIYEIEAGGIDPETEAIDTALDTPSKGDRVVWGPDGRVVAVIVGKGQQLPAVIAI